MLKPMTIVVAAAALLLLPASQAEAQYGPGADAIRTRDSALWLEMAFFTGDVGDDSVLVDSNVTALSPLMRGYFGLGPSFELAFAWGFAWSSVEVDAPGLRFDDDGSTVGNPFLGGSYVLRGRGGGTFRIGGGVALPLADPEHTGDQVAWGMAVAMRGAWDSWLWWPDRLTVVLPSLRYDADRGELVYAFEGAVGMMFYTGDEDDVETEVPLQLAAEIGARLSPRFVLGGRLQAWVLPTGEEDQDNAQLAVEPFVRFEGADAFFLTKLTINIDNPLGFAFDDDGVWGLHVGGGARF